MVDSSAASVSYAEALQSPKWRSRLAAYSTPDAGRATRQLIVTGALLLGSSTLLFWGLANGVWAAMACALPSAFFVVRLFIIQHDCGHGSFFSRPAINNLLGAALGVVTLMPYSAWRHDHAVHHASSGNLGRRGIGDVTTLTVVEYRALPKRRRLAYWIYRHPLVHFVLGPAYVLLIRYRVPMTSPRRNRTDWLSILGTDAAVATLGTGLAILVGPVAFAAGWGSILFLATTIGVWCFYVQHQFEQAYWSPSANWNFYAAALDGSSFYDLPRLLHWLTGSIGFHHIHHLASRIPNYRLRACFDENPELQRAKRVGLWESFGSARLALWDENSQRLVSFRAAGRPS